jgi:hypothetical protein
MRISIRSLYLILPTYATWLFSGFLSSWIESPFSKEWHGISYSYGTKKIRRNVKLCYFLDPQDPEKKTGGIFINPKAKAKNY